MGHLQTGTPETTLNVETFVRFAAIEDGLVAADLFGDEVKSLDQSKTEFLALLIFRDSDVFDVTDKPQAMNAVLSCQLAGCVLNRMECVLVSLQFPLDEKVACAHDLASICVLND